MIMDSKFVESSQ